MNDNNNFQSNFQSYNSNVPIPDTQALQLSPNGSISTYRSLLQPVVTPLNSKIDNIQHVNETQPKHGPAAQQHKHSDIRAHVESMLTANDNDNNNNDQIINKKQIKDCRKRPHLLNQSIIEQRTQVEVKNRFSQQNTSIITAGNSNGSKVNNSSNNDNENKTPNTPSNKAELNPFSQKISFSSQQPCMIYNEDNGKAISKPPLCNVESLSSKQTNAHSSTPLEESKNIVEKQQAESSTTTDAVKINAKGTTTARDDKNNQKNSTFEQQSGITVPTNVQTFSSVNKNQDSDDLASPSAPPHVAECSKVRKNDLSLPLKGFDLSSFSKEQILSLPITFTYTPNDIESESKAKITQDHFLNKKIKTMHQQQPSTEIANNRSDKETKTSEIVYSGIAHGCPPGWRLVEKKRLAGTGKGRIDKRWISPQTGRRFQSSNQLHMFLNCLKKTTNGQDEYEAWNIFKNKKKNGA